MDSFGEPVGLNYKGDDSFKILVGAFFSLVLRLVILIITLQSFIELIDYQNPQITQVSCFL